MGTRKISAINAHLDRCIATRNLSATDANLDRCLARKRPRSMFDLLHMPAKRG
jgi:hypothetical protein